MAETEQKSAVKQEKKPLTKAQKLKRNRARRAYLRAGIQAVFFLLAPALFTSAFSGIKNIFTKIGAGQVLELNSFVIVLLALCGFTVVFGRFFCGYACAFGSLGDLFYWLSGLVQKKLGHKLPRIPEKLRRLLSYLPYVVLLAIVVLCALGIYGGLSGWSPWDVFSMLTALRLHLGGYAVGIVLLVLVVVGMAFESRFFCRFLCPMGAVFRLLPILPWSVLRRNRETCLKGCTACEKACPVETKLSSGCNAGDCIQCGKCLGACPKANCSAGLPKVRGNELWLTAGKAVLLLLLAVLIGASRIG